MTEAEPHQGGAPSWPRADAGWYADPTGVHHRRWWDGEAWTDHVRPIDDHRGVPPDLGPSGSYPADDGSTSTDRTQPPGTVEWRYDADLLSEPTLTVRPVVVGRDMEWAVLDRRQSRIGTFRDDVNKAASRAFGVDHYVKRRFELVDAHGEVILRSTRRFRIYRDRSIVQDSQGRTVGEISQRVVLRKSRYELIANGVIHGAIHSQHWVERGDFKILDSAGHEIAAVHQHRFDKTWARQRTLQIHQPLGDPLRHLVIAALTMRDMNFA